MKKLIFPLMFVLLSSVAYASFSVSHDIIRDTISPLGNAQFMLSVMNEGSLPDSYVITSSDVLWNIQTDPLVDYLNSLYVNDGDLAKTKLILKPNSNIKEGKYFVQINLASKLTGEVKSDIMEVSVDSKIIDYPLTIRAEIIAPARMDPRKTESVQIRLINENPSQISDANVRINSKYVNQITSVDLAPKSEKIVQFTVSFEDKTMAEQKDTLKVVVIKGNDTIAEVKKEIEISSYLKPYQATAVIKEQFLKTTKEVTFTNIEQMQKSQEAAVEAATGFAKIFTKTIPEAEVTLSGDKEYYIWKGISLKPDETYTVEIITDYRPFAIFIAAFVIIFICYYIFRSPVILEKERLR